MLLSPGLQEEVFVPTVHPFWVLVSIVNFLLLLLHAATAVGSNHDHARDPRQQDP